MALYKHDKCVPTGHEEAQEREGRRVSLGEERRKGMSCGISRGSTPSGAYLACGAHK